MGVTDTPLIMGYPAIKEKDLLSLMTASPLPPPDEIMAIEEGKASGEISKHLKTRVLPLLEEYRSKIKSRGSIPASVEPFSLRLVPGEKFVLSSGRRINHAHRGFLKDEIKRLKEARLIVPSMSPFYSPVVIVPKKNGKKRLCIDYRVLNSITVPFQFPLPRIDEI
ncbi:hypothetical protein ADUPG1_002555, partial [Aduncisulcus paluster]